MKPVAFAHAAPREVPAALQLLSEVDAVALAHTIDPTDQRQPLLEQAVNHIPCRSAGWEGLGEAARRLEQDLEKLAAERP